VAEGVVNVEQAEAWNGDEGRCWAAQDEHFDAAVRGHTDLLFGAAAIAPGDAVLDVGCGTGLTTRLAARAASSGTALGLDLSTLMLQRARDVSRAEGIANVTFVDGDAQVYAFDAGTIDVVISRFGAMFFADPVAAFRNIAGALRSDGRMTLVVWRRLEDNEWLAAWRGALAIGRDLPAPQVGAPGPFGLADPGRTRSVLEAAGLVDVRIEPHDVPFDLGTGVDDAFDFVSQIPITRGMLDGLDAADRATALGTLREVIAAHETGGAVRFGSGVWLVTARRA
jgi:SAM-dependent methyltransferase